LSAKEHGRQKLVEGKPPSKGAKVAIVDDVVTTGDSILQAVHQAEEEGYEVSTVIAILDRNEGGREVIEGEGYRFWALFTVSRTPDNKPSFRFNGYPLDI
jgi:orotate phosphoribosyltransferase